MTTLSPPAIQPLTMQVHTTFDPALRTPWNALALQTSSDYYMSYDFCQIWWSHYSQRRDLLIVTFRHGDDLVAILPLFLETLRLGPVSLRLAKLLGSDHTIALSDPPILPPHAPAVLHDALPALSTQHSIDAFHFGPLSNACPNLATLRQIRSDSSPTLTLARDTTLSTCAFLTLPPTIDLYCQSLSAKRRSNHKRATTLLHQTCRIQTDLITHPHAVEAEFHNFITMHTQQWRLERKLGHFGDWPNSIPFNLDLVRTQAANNQLRLIRIRADSQTIAYEYCLSFGRTWHWRLSARLVGQPWTRLDLGHFAFFQMVQLAIQDHATLLELGPGHYPYKLALGAHEHPYQSLLLVRDHWPSRLRAALFSRLSNLLHFLYYRLYFLKLAPRLPFPRTPLSQLWIRTRI